MLLWNLDLYFMIIGLLQQLFTSIKILISEVNSHRKSWHMWCLNHLEPDWNGWIWLYQRKIHHFFLYQTFPFITQCHFPILLSVPDRWESIVCFLPVWSLNIWFKDGDRTIDSDDVLRPCVLFSNILLSF